MKRALVSLVTLLVLIVGGVFIYRSVSASAKKDQNSYRIAAVKKETVKKTVTATGVLKAWTTVDIKSRAGGRIDKMIVDDGTEVKKGDPICEIDPSDVLLNVNTAKADIDANKSRIDQSYQELALQKQQSTIAIKTAEASLASAIAQANSAKARYESAKSSSQVAQELTDATVDNAKATLATERARLDQMTKATQPQQNAQAISAYNQAMANMTNAEAQLRRTKALLEKGFIAASQVDQAQAQYEVAKATVASAREVTSTIAPQLTNDIKVQEARVKQAQSALRTAEANRIDVQLRQQSAAAAKADYEQAQAGVLTAQANLRRAKEEMRNVGIRQTAVVQSKAQIERSKATLTNANIQLKDTRVSAPSDGIILQKYVEQGTLVSSGISFNSTGVAIVQLGDISRMYVEVQVDETDVANVDIGQKVDITFDAYATTPFEGKVIKVNPQATVEQNVTTVKVRVEVDNSVPSYRLLKPGMNATCEFISEKKEDVVAIPNEALKTDNDGKKYVEIAQGGKIAPADKDSEADPNLLIECKIVKKPIEIGLEGNDYTEIKSGLNEGDKIITQTIEPTVASASGNPFGGSRGPGRSGR